MSYFVKKIEWEYGEAYGHVYWPKNSDDFQNILNQLKLQTIAAGTPYYVELYFDDGNYLGLIVGYPLTCFVFGALVSNTSTSDDPERTFDSHHVKNDSNDAIYIQYSYKGDHGEVRLSETLSTEQAMDALEYYIKHQKFPSFISFSKREIIDKYIDKSD